MVNVAKTEPLNMSRKRKLSSCENEDRSGPNAKVSYQIKSWSLNVLFNKTLIIRPYHTIIPAKCLCRNRNR